MVKVGLAGVSLVNGAMTFGVPPEGGAMIPILTDHQHGHVPARRTGACWSPRNTDALIDGAPALLLTDVHPIVGCPFAPAGVYTPCVTIRWVMGATQTKVHGVPVLLQTSIGLCLNAAQAPQGMAVVVQAQHAREGDLT